MSTNKKKILIIALIIVIAAGWWVVKAKGRGASDEIIQVTRPFIGAVKTFISTTGTVLPKNRLEIKPPVSGRIEEILAREGDKVKKGQTLAWMSSTERAALLDAARGKDEKTLQYWQETYKPIPLLAPIDGEVIVATTQGGQTVTTADAVIVLSDELIVRAQVDETDIGKIFLGQKAVIALDAYQDKKIKAVVEHIYYESETVNNVTIYKVDLIPESIADFFRSGMNASIDFADQDKENILLLPVEAVHRDKDQDYVFVKNNGAGQSVKTPVKLGISDDKNIEVVSGVGPDDSIIVKTKKYVLPKDTTGANPFMPSRRR